MGSASLIHSLWLHVDLLFFDQSWVVLSLYPCSWRSCSLTELYLIHLWDYGVIHECADSQRSQDVFYKNFKDTSLCFTLSSPRAPGCPNFFPHLLWWNISNESNSGFDHLLWPLQISSLVIWKNIFIVPNFSVSLLPPY